MKRFLIHIVVILSFVFSLNAQEVFINEINYLSETRPFVEVVSPSTVDIDGYTLHFYDTAGNVYFTQEIEIGESENTPETGSSPSDECISRFIIADVVIMLGEDKSGVALTDPYNSLVQFVSYGGTNTGQEGPAKNVVSEDIGKQIDPNTSLQLTGLGNSYDDFTWDSPSGSTAGEVNTDQEVSCDEISVPGAFNLPVEWISFTAEAEQKGIALAWQTATEEDNNGFILEHSRNGFEFITIANIAAKGTASEGGNYTYFDNKPVTGENYYRIAQMDGSGEKSYFRLLNVNFAANGSYDIFPNPAQTKFTLELPNAQEEVQIDIINAAGQIVQTIELEQADIFIPISIDNLAKGYYQIIVQSRSDSQHLPLIIN
ncbi:MAG: T9SS type A sorting domain-containing protein [Saprospiraceae bacterium]